MAGGNGALTGFSPISSSSPVFWKSRRTSSSSSSALSKQNVENDNDKVDEKHEKFEETKDNPITQDVELSDRRKALFEPLEPMITNINGKRPSAEYLIPPPDFDSTTYPRGWLIGKKRKLVNVDVVESMRRIAVQEMNRKDREIDGLNEQLEEDARCLEHLQVQLLEERSKRAHIERENARLQSQTDMLTSMLMENEPMEDDETTHEP